MNPATRSLLARRVLHNRRRRGFTILELMVAMAITALIVTVLVSITGIALDSWRRSRAQVRSARLAKAALETLAKDFESMMVRSGNSYQWLVARVEPELASGGSLAGPGNNQMPNAAQLVFFNSATDRYQGNIGGADDLGGDVSAVGYRLVYRDPILDRDGGSNAYPVFALYRNLIDPKPAFDTLLGQTDLLNAYRTFQSGDFDPENFVVENIFGLTVTFVVEYQDANDPKVTKTRRVAVMQDGGSNAVREFIIAGDWIKVTGGGTADPALAAGRVVAVDLSITVLSDFGLQQAARTALPPERIIRDHGFHYAKSVIVPSP